MVGLQKVLCLLTSTGASQALLFCLLGLKPVWNRQEASPAEQWSSGCCLHHVAATGEEVLWGDGDRPMASVSRAAIFSRTQCIASWSTSKGTWSSSPRVQRRKKFCSPCAGWTGQDITGWSCHQRHPGWVVETSELYRIAKTDRYLQDSSLDFCPGWHFDRLLTHTFCQELETIISRTRQTLPGWATGWMESHKLGRHMRMRTGQIARKSLLC